MRLWFIVLAGLLCLGLASCPSNDDYKDTQTTIEDENMRQPDFKEGETPAETSDETAAPAEGAEGGEEAAPPAEGAEGAEANGGDEGEGAGTEGTEEGGDDSSTEGSAGDDEEEGDATEGDESEEEAGES